MTTANRTSRSGSISVVGVGVVSGAAPGTAPGTAVGGIATAPPSELQPPPRAAGMFPRRPGASQEFESELPGDAIDGAFPAARRDGSELVRAPGFAVASEHRVAAAHGSLRVFLHPAGAEEGAQPRPAEVHGPQLVRAERKVRLLSGGPALGPVGRPDQLVRAGVPVAELVAE